MAAVSGNNIDDTQNKPTLDPRRARGNTVLRVNSFLMPFSVSEVEFVLCAVL